MMDNGRVQQSYTERKAFDAAYELIQGIIEIKSTWPQGTGYNSVLKDPRAVVLMKNLENWTDFLVKDGGL